MNPKVTQAKLALAARWKDAALIIALCASILASWSHRISSPVDLRFDGGVYYILGTSLAEGNGYRLLNEPEEIEAVQYPPLLPLIVAAHQWLLGTSDPMIVGRWLKLWLFIVFTFYVFAAYAMLRGCLPLRYAFLGTLIVVLSLYTYLMSNMLAPEIPFALATVLFFLCHRDRSTAYPMLAGIFAIAAYAFRTIGVVLFLAWITESLFQRDLKKTTARLIITVAAVVSWQAYIHYVESSSHYKNPAYEYQRADYMFYNVSYARNIFRMKDSFNPELGYASTWDIIDRLLQNLYGIPGNLGEAVSVEKKVWSLPHFGIYFGGIGAAADIWSIPTSWGPAERTWWFVNCALFVIGVLIIGGLGLQLARREWFIPFYVLLSLTAICLTPWPVQFVRYLTPVAPFLVLSLFKMLVFVETVFYRVLAVKWKFAGMAVTTGVVLLITTQEINIFRASHLKWRRTVVHSDLSGNPIRYRVFAYTDSKQALDKALDWLQSRAKREDVIALSMPHWAHIRTGLKTVMPPFEPDPLEAQRLLDSVPVNYLVIDEQLGVDSRKYTAPVLKYFSAMWMQVYSDPKGRLEIYQRVNAQGDSFTFQRRRGATHSNRPLNLGDSDSVGYLATTPASIN
jgi:hypothetical protein